MKKHATVLVSKMINVREDKLRTQSAQVVAVVDHEELSGGGGA